MASDAQAKGQAWVLETAFMIAGTVMQGRHPPLRKWFLSEGAALQLHFSAAAPT